MSYRDVYVAGASFDRNQHQGLGLGASWLGAVFVLVLLFPLRFDYEWYFFSTISVLDPVLLFLLTGLLLLVSLTGRLMVGERSVFIILILPVIFALLSLTWTVDAGETVKSIIVYGAAVIAYLIAVALFREWSVAKLLKTTVLASWILVVTAVFSYIPGSPIAPEITFSHQNLEGSGFLLSYYARLSHPFLGLSNSFATILAMLLPIVTVGSRIGVWPRFTNITGILLIAAIFATGSRGVLIALMLVYGLLVVWQLIAVGAVSRSLLKKLIVGCIAVVALIVGFFVLSPTAIEHVGGRLDASNIDARLQAFGAVFNVSIFEYPFGIGSGVGLFRVSEVGLTSVHNAYLQNILWFGMIFGILLSAAMVLLPYVIWKITVSMPAARYVRAAVAISAAVLMLINISQASWEGSMLRIWIYVLLAIGVVMIRRAEEAPPRR